MRSSTQGFDYNFSTVRAILRCVAWVYGYYRNSIVERRGFKPNFSVKAIACALITKQFLKHQTRVTIQNLVQGLLRYCQFSKLAQPRARSPFQFLYSQIRAIAILY
jgi:hypothetical protein